MSKDLNNQELENVFSNPSQANIPQMIEKINEEIAKITKSQEGGRQTSGKRLFNYGEVANITEIPTLIRAAASLLLRETSYQESLNDLGLSNSKYPYKLEGRTGDQFRQDIKIRLSEITNSERLSKLKAAKLVLEENLSKEQKFAVELNKIADLFSEE